MNAQTAVQRRAGRRWVAIIFGLLALQVGMTSVGIAIAVRHAPPIESDYYNKALRWDERKQAEDAVRAAEPLKNVE
jgi:hypothetical protein